MSFDCDVCVIGSGPGGYVSAIRASQLGLKTILVEKEKLGGVCLNVGCIPSKAMITASHFFHKAQNNASEMGLEISGEVKVNMKKMASWKQSICDRMSGGVAQLLAGNNVKVVQGEACFLSTEELEVKNSGETSVIRAKKYVIATGSRPVELKEFPIDETDVLSSTGALDLEKLPKKIVVIGGGYIGLEISSYLATLGSQVTILEAGNQLLKNAADKDSAQVVTRKLKKNGVVVHTKAFAKSFSKNKTKLSVQAEINGEMQALECDKILVTVGRKPNSDQMNLQQIGIKCDDKGFLVVSAQRQTNISNIFAIGDICGQPMLAHKASYEGILVAEVLAGKNRVYDVKTVPAVIFTDPEIAYVGLTEDECKAKGLSIKAAKFPFAANGRAVSMIETDGFVKIIAEKDSHLILGIHIVGPEASNLISEGALALEMGARLEDLALTIHPHPTLGETLMEAAEATLGHPIHMIQKKG